MSEEAVLFPSKPLFMVDRSWQRRNRKNFPTKDFENSSRVPEITITVLNGSKASPKAKSKPTNAKSDVASKAPPSASAKFLNYRPPATGGGGGRKRKKRSFNQEADGAEESSNSKRNSSLAPGCARPADDESEYPFFLTRSIPNSTSPVCTVIDPEVSAFEKFLAYCSFIHPSNLA